MLELLAKNLAIFNTFKPNYHLKDLLQDLGEQGVLGIRNAEVATAYQAKGWKLRKETPERILAAMYDLRELPEGARQVLSCFAVLPAESIRYESLEVLLPKRASLAEDLKYLIQSGWLDFNEDLIAFKVSPVVQEVALKKNPQLATDCKPLIEAMEVKLEYEGAVGHLPHSSYEEARLLARYGETVLASLRAHSEALFVLYDRVGYYYRTVGKLPQSQKVFEGYSAYAKALHDQDPENVSVKNGLAISYAKLGSTYSSLGNLGQALTFFEDYNRLENELYKAYPENVSVKNSLAISYSKLGDTHSSLGNLDKALEFFENYNHLENELYEAYPENEAFKKYLAISYEKLGSTHSSLGNLDKALEFFEDYNHLENELYEAIPKMYLLKTDWPFPTLSLASYTAHWKIWTKP